jgi:ABC-2 type transport system permease protein
MIKINPTLLGFIRKEITQTLRDPRMKFFLFVTPVIQMTLFGIAISNEVKNIRLAAIFDREDWVMRDLYERSIEGKWFVPAKSRETDPFKMIQSGDADAVLVAQPRGLTKGIGRGDAPLQVLIDATNVTQAQAVENYLTAIAQQTVADDLHVVAPTPPIQFDLRVLYNPALETSLFMVPGVMCLIAVMTTMILCMTAITREKEMGTFEMLISAPVTPSEVIFGKTVPYVVLGMCNYPLTLAVAVFLFQVPMRGSFLLLTLSAFFFVCTSVAMGTLISTICKNQQQANLASFLFMFPAIMFSGLLFPIDNMPLWLKPVAYMDPLFHYLSLLRNVMLKGGDVRFALGHMAILGVIGAASIVISFRRFRTTLQ